MITSLLEKQLQTALQTPCPTTCNQRITGAHYSLSTGLAKLLGPEVGANFHSWAVWGSLKAGTTIRQEDLDSAITNATWVAGAVGAATGLVAKSSIQKTSSLALSMAAGALGSFAGALAGRSIAKYSRHRAAEVILEGNRTVLEDIGTYTARFIQYFENQAVSASAAADFTTTIPQSPEAPRNNQLLRSAFHFYAIAGDRSLSLTERQQACFHANTFAIFHEHIRLDPIIGKSMPWIIQKCVTQRMMNFQVGTLNLSVAQPLDSTDQTNYAITIDDHELENWMRSIGWQPSPSASTNWTNISQRMHYILELFRLYHKAPDVFSPLSAHQRI